jgi:hypothetical protein
VRRDEVSAAVTTAAADAWRADWQQTAEPGDVLAAAAGHADRFRSREWTWSR